MTLLLGIDPGPAQTAVVWLIGGQPSRFAILPNAELAAEIDAAGAAGIKHLACEMIASYGMPVGAEVFETCVWIGRILLLAELAGMRGDRLTRIQVKTHLCHSARANDSNVRQALIDRYGRGQGAPVALGSKKSPGPLYGVSRDVWAALAVAVTWADLRGAA